MVYIISHKEIISPRYRRSIVVTIKTRGEVGRDRSYAVVTVKTRGGESCCVVKTREEEGW